MDRLTAMAAFVAVVDSGSFSKAAKVLQIGQPAVSKIITQLESHLQVRLLLRSTHGLTPTEAGRRFYDGARATLKSAEETEIAARELSNGLAGHLRLSAAPAFTRLHIIPHLSRFLDAHPALSVDIILDDRPIDLIAEGIDIALRLGGLSDSNAVAHKLASGRRSVMATPEYVQRMGALHTPQDIMEHNTLIYSPTNNGWTFNKAKETVTVTPRGRLQFSAGEGLRAALLAGLGLTIASEWMFTDELADGRVIRLLDDWHLPDIDLWAVFPTGRMATAKARQFARFVGELLDAERILAPDALR